MIERQRIVHNGVEYLVTVEADPDDTPASYDCYTTEQVAAWQADEWQFVSVVVEDGAGHGVYLAGIEYGRIMPGRFVSLDTFLTEPYMQTRRSDETEWTSVTLVGSLIHEIEYVRKSER